MPHAGRGKSVADDLCGIVDGLGRFQHREGVRTGDERIEIDHGAFGAEKSVERSMRCFGNGTGADDFPKVIDPEGPADNAAEGQQIGHLAVGDEEGVLDDVFEEVGMADDLAGRIDPFCRAGFAAQCAKIGQETRLIANGVCIPLRVLTEADHLAGGIDGCGDRPTAK